MGRLGTKTYQRDTNTGKLVESHLRTDLQTPAEGSAMINREFQDFKSPLDGSIITSGASLRAHNKHHGVTDSRDYSPEYLASRKASGERQQASEARASRIHNLRRSFEQQERR